jgi:Tol biopolymer transport system component/DNA-binding winged helix-turn-helix (wHTH) protein
VGSVGSNGTRVIHFGIFEVDTKAGELRRNGSRVRLQEQPFQILTSLLEQPGQVVTREELRGKLWPADTFVDFDHSLNAAIRRLRDALGDSAENPRFVETVARRGYRFIAPINGTGAAASAAQPALPASPALRWWHWTVMGALVLAVGAAIGWRIGHVSPSPPARERRITANSEDTPVIGASLSPDGKYLAFADRTGFYLRQLATGETHPVTLPSGFTAVPASWFPDGVHLVVLASAGAVEAPSIWEISALGGTPHKLAERGWHPSVSRDGSRIVFLAGSESSNEVWVMQADGTNPRKLLGGRQDIFGSPVWSPNGKQIAYVRGKYRPGTFGFQGQIEIYQLDSGRTTGWTKVVTASPLLTAALVWTSDGRLVYALSEPPPNENDANLWAQHIDADTGTARGAAVRLTSASGSIRNLSLTSDGRRLGYSRDSIAPDVYVTDLISGGQKLTPLRRLTLDENADYPYTWTHDSKAVIFVSDRTGTYQIYRQAPDQASPELLQGGPEDLTIVRLTPRGDSILYIVPPKRGAASNTARLMRLPLSGGPPQLVLEAPGINNHQCARFPATICIVSQLEPGRERFFTFDPVKGLGSELVNAKVEGDDYYQFNWSLSPDGKTLALAKKRAFPDNDESIAIGKRVPGPVLPAEEKSGASGAEPTLPKGPTVWLFSLADGTERPLPLPGWAGFACLDWASDGKSIWVQAHTAVKQALLNVDLSGRARAMLELEDSHYLGWAIQSPDGKHLAIWKGNGNANVWMLENF